MFEDKIAKSKIQLIMNQPFFATLALGFRYEETDQTETADIDGKTLRYNPNFVKDLPMAKLNGLIAHEVMHVANLHHTRRSGRDIAKWNKACDYAINQILIDAKFELPDGALLDPAYVGMSAEQIYAKLPDDPNDKGKSDPGGTGGVKDAPGDTEPERKQAEADAKQMLQKAAMIAKKAGTLPAGFEELIKDIMQPKIDWRAVLSEFLTEKSRADYTWRQPSKRYLYAGLYLPSLESVEKGKFIFALDTSSSVDDEKLSEFGSEVQSAVNEVAESLTVYHVDTKVQKIEEFEADDQLVLIAKGRGGTDFRPAFDDIEQKGIEPAALVYFTDGDCSSFPKDPGYPVLWAIYGPLYKKFNPPFGDKILIE